MIDQLLPGVGQVFAGRYRLLNELGQGGMGVVYRALDLETEKMRALKVIRPDLTLDKSVRGRFVREIKVLRHLDHENIVAIHDDGKSEEGFYYFAMDLVTGPNLATYADPVDPLTFDQVFLLFGQVCDAIEHAHSRGVVHRDLKPTNIIIQDGQTVKLLDFGLARLQSDGVITLPGQALGTASYMAPEVGRGEEAGPAADIYALGCLIFQLATGLLPFQGESPVDIVLTHQNKKAPGIRDYRSDASQNMERAIMRALDKDPSKRFGSALEFFKNLTRPDQGDGEQSWGSWWRKNVEQLPKTITSIRLRSAQWSMHGEVEIPGAGILGGWVVKPSPDFQWLAVGADCLEGPLLYDIHAQEWSRLGAHGAGVNVRSLIWSRSGRMLAFVNSERLVLVDMSGNKCVARLDVSNHRPWSLALLPTSTGKPKALACGESGGIVVWEDWPRGVPEVFRAHPKTSRVIKLYPGGGFFVTGGFDGAVNFWRSKDFKRFDTVQLENVAIWDMEFSRFGQLLAAATSDTEEPIRIFSIINNRIEHIRAELKGRAISVAFSQSSRLLAVGCHQRISFLEPTENDVWKISEEVEVEGEVRSLAFGAADRSVHAVTSTRSLITLRRGGSHTTPSPIKVSTKEVGALADFP